MHSLQSAEICYFTGVKRFALFSIFLLIGGFGAISSGYALSPKQENATRTDLNDDASLPISQEATEESVLPEEPQLSTPAPPSVAPDPSISGVQALPSGDPFAAAGPTIDDQRRIFEKFRAAKSAAQEDPAIANIKVRAFASPTEKQKRAILREYYQAIALRVTQANPTLKNPAEIWSYLRQNRLARTRTEPDYQPVALPAAIELLQKAQEKPSEEETTERGSFLPSLQ